MARALLRQMAGRRFGRLVVESRVAGSYRWRARCDCGRSIVADGANIRAGRTSSCGCARRTERPAEAPPSVADCRWIALTRGQFALVDAVDFERLNEMSWYAHRTRQCSFYACSRAAPRIWMHRLVLGAPQDAIVDHQNGDRLDNRRTNLRLCTPSQNVQNSVKSLRGWTSSFRGVSLRRERWMARITHDGRTALLGTYPTEEEAAHAYDSAARDLYGAHARTNFVAKE